MWDEISYLVKCFFHAIRCACERGSVVVKLRGLQVLLYGAGDVALYAALSGTVHRGVKYYGLPMISIN
jgi:hypothetical protein